MKTARKQRLGFRRKILWSVFSSYLHTKQKGCLRLEPFNSAIISVSKYPRHDWSHTSPLSDIFHLSITNNTCAKYLLEIKFLVLLLYLRAILLSFLSCHVPCYEHADACLAITYVYIFFQCHFINLCNLAAVRNLRNFQSLTDSEPR